MPTKNIIKIAALVIFFFLFRSFATYPKFFINYHFNMKPFGPITADNSFKYKITLENDSISKIDKLCILMATYKKKLKGDGILKISSNDRKINLTRVFPLQSVRDNSFYCFTELNLSLHGHKTLFIELKAGRNVEKPFTVWLNEKNQPILRVFSPMSLSETFNYLVNKISINKPAFIGKILINIFYLHIFLIMCLIIFFPF